MYEHTINTQFVWTSESMWIVICITVCVNNHCADWVKHYPHQSMWTDNHRTVCVNRHLVDSSLNLYCVLSADITSAHSEVIFSYKCWFLRIVLFGNNEINILLKRFEIDFISILFYIFYFRTVNYSSNTVASLKKNIQDHLRKAWNKLNF